MKALVTGIAGQDASYLAEHLLELGYEVHGLVRRHSEAESQTSRIAHLGDKITLHYGDVTDSSSIVEALKKSKPDEVYNLAAQSHVRISFDVPAYTLSANAIGAFNVFEQVRIHCPSARVYQASSSEMFGNSVDHDGVQRLTTPMTPVSPYGCSKLLAFHLSLHYRNSHKIHASNGILFNHESPRRGSNFVTSKIIKGAVEIKLGKREKLELGNLDSYRDWGHSKDYVRAMHLILNHKEPDDFIVATGEAHSVRDFCKIAFDKLGLYYENYVVQNERLLRPTELEYLKGDAGKARELLGWKPTYTFDSMIEEMLEYWMRKLHEKA